MTTNGQLRHLVCRYMISANKYRLVFFWLLFLTSVLSGDESLEVKQLRRIAIKHVANAQIFVELSKKEEDLVMRKALMDEAMLTLEDCFILYLIFDKFNNNNSLSASAKKMVSILLNKLTVEQIRSGFRGYLNPSIAENTTFHWPVENYTLEKFRKDFPDFLALKDQ